MEHPLDQLRPDEPSQPPEPPVPTDADRGRAEPVDRTVAEPLDLESLRRKVASQPTIEQAKGMLMGYYGIDAEQAFALLRRWSSSRHVKLRDLCRAVVEAGSTPGPHPYAGLRAVLGSQEPGAGPTV